MEDTLVKEANKTVTIMLVVFVILWLLIIGLSIASIYMFLKRRYEAGVALAVVPVILLIVFIVLKIRQDRKKTP